MATLYRKYRPSNFSEVFGQKFIKQSIENQIKADNISHAYLFCGPRAVGKTTLARIFSKAINCLNRKKGESEPCGKCERCTEILQGKNLDIIEIDGASNNSIDNVRDNIIKNSFVPPSTCKYKVFIIDEVHMLSTSAFNALLKILEEPPSYVVFILCTTELHKMPSTIISRCQRFDFKKIGIKEVVRKLDFIAKSENIEIEPAVLEAIARQADGHMRDAESILDQIVAISDKKITVKEADLILPRSDIDEVVSLILLISENKVGEAVELINNLVDNGVDLASFTNDLMKILRKIMIAKVNFELLERIGTELSENLEIKFNQCVQNLKLNQILNIINKLLVAKNSLSSSYIIQLPLEIAIIELCEVGYNNLVDKKILNSKIKTDTEISKIKDVDKVIDKNPIPKIDEKVNIVEEISSKVSKIKPEISGDDKTMEKKVINEWSNIISKVNPSLNMILKSCKIDCVLNGNLVMSFSNNFYYKNFNNEKMKLKVEEIIFEVCNLRLKVKAILEDKKIVEGNGSDSVIEIEKKEQKVNNNTAEDNAPKEDKTFLNDVLETFDGTVI